MIEEKHAGSSDPSSPRFPQHLHVFGAWLGSHIFALMLFAVGIAILALSSILLIKSLLAVRPDDSEGYTVRVSPPLFSSSGAWTESTSPSFRCKADCAIVTLKIQRLDPSSRHLIGAVTVEAKDSLLENLWSNDQYVAPVDPDHRDKRMLKQEFLELQAELEFWNLLGGGSDQTIGIPLGTLFPKSPHRVAPVSYPIDLEVAGDPTQYPSDWYTADYELYFKLPDSVSTRLERNEGYTLRVHIPVELRVQSDVGMAGKTMRIQPQSGSLAPMFNMLNLIIERDQTMTIFVYLMATLPIMLTVIFAHMLFRNRKSKNERLHIFLLDAVAVMLAVLPLRTVLVPSEMEGFLRIDFVLAWGLALIVSITIMKYANEIWLDANEALPTSQLSEIQEPDHA